MPQTVSQTPKLKTNVVWWIICCSCKEWYKSSIGKKGFVVFYFVCKCCSGTRCSWLWWLHELALPVMPQQRQLCQDEMLEDIGQHGLVQQDLMEVVGRVAVCSSHSSGGLSEAKGMGVAVFPFGIRSNKLVGLGQLKSLPYRKIFIILMWIAYDSKSTFIKLNEPIFQVWNFLLLMVLLFGKSFT